MGKRNGRARDSSLMPLFQAFPTNSAYWLKVKSFANGRIRMTWRRNRKSYRAMS
jgi:hypothetical protein